MFGVSVGVQRLPIAARRARPDSRRAFLLGGAAPIRPRRRSGDQRIGSGPVGGLGLAVAPRLLMFARRIFIDIYISMFMALTLLFFALAERYPERRRLFLC